MPVLTLVRPKKQWGAYRPAEVVLDSTRVVALPNGSGVPIEVPSGRHTVSARIAGFSSKVHPFVVESDLTVLVLAPAMPAFTLLRRFVLRQNIVTLQITPGG